MTANGTGKLGVDALSRKEKGLKDIDNNVVTAAWERGIRGLKGNGKNTIKIKFLIRQKYEQ